MSSSPDDIKLKEQLQSEVLIAVWSDLKDHAERGALFSLSVELDLVEVGFSVARDEAEVVSGLISANKITRPTMEQMESWNQNPTQTFRSLIVAPFVLIQTVGH